MRGGERLARLVFERYLDRLARGLSQVVNTLDPDVFVLGGGMSNVDELYDELPGPAGLVHVLALLLHTGRARGARRLERRPRGGMAVAMSPENDPEINDATGSTPGSPSVTTWSRRPARSRCGTSGACRRSWCTARAPRDVVSEADTEVEDLIRARIREAFPSDGFLGEETGLLEVDGSTGTWVVDPIDGTQPFVSGLRSLVRVDRVRA